MKKQMLIIVLMMMYVMLIAQTDDWLWARRAGGTDQDMGLGIAVDNSGNSYVTGWFSGTGNFGESTLISSGGNDVFVAKIDKYGNWLWVKQAGGTSGDCGYKIAIDLNGNCYVTGLFTGTATFGSTLLTSSGTGDIFVAKLDSNGTWLWAKKAGGQSMENTDLGLAISVDAMGCSYVTGYFYGTANFGNISLTSIADADIFVTKLDTDGNWLWALSAGGTGFDIGSAISTDINGNNYFSGYFSGTSSFGSTFLTSNGFRDMYVAKLDSNGNWLWVKRAGGSGNTLGHGISFDTYGNCYVTGSFQDTANFGSDTLVSWGSSDIFIVKLDSSGNWLWTKQAGSIEGESGSSIVIDTFGNCFLTGNFQGTASFGSSVITSHGSDDAFIAKLDSSGNWLWVKQAGGIDYDYGICIATDNKGNGYVIGSFQTIANFDGDSLTSSGDYDVFIAKLGYPYPRITTNPNSRLDFGTVYLGSSSLQEEVWIINTGSEDLVVESILTNMTDSCFTILSHDLPFSISQGDSIAINIVFNPQVVGNVTDSLYIHNNSPNKPIYTVQLKGRGEYVPPKPPDNLNIHIDGHNCLLNWDAVTQTIWDTPFEPDYYLVYYNGSENPEGQFYYHGATPNLNYTHYLVGLHSEHMFYRIKAYKYFGNGRTDITSQGLQPGMSEAEVLEILSRSDYR